MTRLEKFAGVAPARGKGAATLVRAPARQSINQSSTLRAAIGPTIRWLKRSQRRARKVRRAPRGPEKFGGADAEVAASRKGSSFTRLVADSPLAKTQPNLGKCSTGTNNAFVASNAVEVMSSKLPVKLKKNNDVSPLGMLLKCQEVVVSPSHDPSTNPGVWVTKQSKKGNPRAHVNLGKLAVAASAMKEGKVIPDKEVDGRQYSHKCHNRLCLTGPPKDAPAVAEEQRALLETGPMNNARIACR